MPLRYGFYGSGAQRGAEGLFSGLEAAAEPMLQLSQRRMEADTTAKAALLKEVRDKVIDGGMRPEQANLIMQTAGAPVPNGYFESMQPPLANRVQKAIAPSLAAKTPTDFQPLEVANLALRSMGANEMAGPGNASAFTEPGSFDETDPLAATPYFAKWQSLLNAEPSHEIGKTDTPSFPDSNVPPDIMAQGGMQPEGETDFTPTTIMGKQNPFTGQMMETGRQPSGPSAIVAGRVKGIEARAAAPDEGSAQAQIEDLMRGPKAATAGAEEQARQNVQYSPDMLKARAKLAAMEEGARLDMQASRLNYKQGVVQTDNGLPYLDLEQFQGIDQRLAAESASKNGLTVLRGPQIQLLHSDDDAIRQLDMIADIIPKLPKNIAGLPFVELERRSQSDPQLAGILRALPPAGLGMARVMAGTTGFRSNNQEMTKAIDAYLTSTTAETKAVSLSAIYKIIVGAQTGVVLPRDAATRKAKLEELTAPIALPNAQQQGLRSYRVGDRTIVFNRDGSLAGTVTPARK